MLMHYSLGFMSFDVATVVTELKYATKYHYVAARKHVQETMIAAISTAESHVIDTWIRRQINQLAFGRQQVRIVKQCCGTEACAVEYDVLA